MDETPKKSFFRKFLWPWITLSVILIAGISLLVVSLLTNKNNSENENKQNDFFSDEGSQYNERIVKAFTPTTGAAFKYNSPTIVNDYLYIGTSSRIGYDKPEENIAAAPDNFFYKMDLDLNVIWEYSFGEPMVVSGAVLDSMGNIYFVTESMEYNSSGTADLKNKEHIFNISLFFTSLTNDGKLRWQKPISVTDDNLDHAMFTPAIGTDDTIYIGHDKLYAFDTEGSIKWSYPGKGKKIMGFSSGAIIDKRGYVYFVSPQPISANKQEPTDKIYMYKFDPQTGDIIWSTKLGNETMEPEGRVVADGQPIGGGGSPIQAVNPVPAFGISEELVQRATATDSESPTS